MKYRRNGMAQTMDYVKDMYARADVSRNRDSLALPSRGRDNFEHYAMMRDELAWMFNGSQARSFVWSGHSIWLRRFFKFFGDTSDDLCAKLSEEKIENTAVIAFDAYRLKLTRDDLVMFVSAGIHQMSIDDPW